MPANFVVTDVETGGLDKVNGKSHELYPITEIAMNICDPLKFKTIETFHTFVQPYNDLEITKEALMKSGVSMSDVNSGMDSRKLVSNIIVVARKAKSGKLKPILVGHNLSEYDLPFFVYLFALHGKDLFDYFSKETVDTLTLCRAMFLGSGDDVTANNLGVCCKKLGIKLSNAHSAQADTNATQKVLKAVITRLRSNTGVIEKEEESEKENHRKHFSF